ncbi:abortive infection protein, internal deletion [Halomonas citrativorans]|uniref:Abortive infection protein, internal deletion n=1 Tax=Halomonas citrativorans TaxID=2742612 RepID=A0A1R4I4M4_9GAMM|nr:ATP-binding protein [Halomonas citrativorans]SJN14283.1 abortive infection protein, internal deletion [Halomonas citrativorans]
MIKNLSFKNFYSFADDTVIDFALGKKPTPSGYDIDVDGERYNKAIAVVGANGSGKTQLLKPLAFLHWFITDSFLGNDPERDIPINGHALNGNEASRFELEFREGGADYRYQLELTSEEVLFEALYEKTSSQYSYLFKREKTEKGYSFKQKGFPFPKAQAEKLRGNVSLISAAYSYDVETAKPFIDFFSRIETNVVSVGRRHFHHGALVRAATAFQKDPELQARMSKALSAFDLGLENVDIRKLTARDETGQEEEIYLPFGTHTTADGRSFELSFFEESSGTQSAFVLLEPILNTLQNGGIAVIDEIDNDLHPHLVPHLLEWFEFEHTNPHQAQLIFTCHTPEVLNLLQKHQIYLVEKRNQQSDAWRLDDMTGLRADDNLYAKYMAGALGATPEL